VRVSVQHTLGSHSDEETHTLSLNAHGALILLSTPVPKGRRLELLNIATGDRAECIVASLGQHQGDRTEVGGEFILPNPQILACSVSAERLDSANFGLVRNKTVVTEALQRWIQRTRRRTRETATALSPWTRQYDDLFPSYGAFWEARSRPFV
jgi:hypothetical protein